jgi:hypothetical protein
MMPEQLLTELRKLKESGVGDAELWAVAFQAGEAKALQEAFLSAAKPPAIAPAELRAILQSPISTWPQNGSHVIELPRTESEQAALDANNQTAMQGHDRWLERSAGCYDQD